VRGLRPLSGWDAADAAAAALAAVATLAAVAPVPAAARAVVVAPFLLALPGYALLRIAFPRPLLAGDAALLGAGLSISFLVIAGLVLDKVGPGLTAGAWLVAVDAWTAIALLVARRRRAPGAGFGRVRLPRPRIGGQTAAFVLAGAVAAAAFALNMRGAQAQERRERFVELWVVPSGPDRVVVGIRSGEPGATRYRLTLSDGSTELRTWSGIDLEWGRQWQSTVALPAGVRAGDELAALAYRGSSQAPVRSVHVVAPG
jgi:hypothetical protein